MCKKTKFKQIKQGWLLKLTVPSGCKYISSSISTLYKGFSDAAGFSDPDGLSFKYGMAAAKARQMAT